MATYRNPWHKPGKPEYGPAFFTCRNEPRPYRGYLIFRQHERHFDVVRDGVCVSQRAGARGARWIVDLICDNPADFWAQRSLSYLSQGATAEHQK